MSATDRLALLQEFYREKAALHRRHQASAERVSAYDSNNAYQYVLDREAAHLDWVRRALAEVGASPDKVARIISPKVFSPRYHPRLSSARDSSVTAAFLSLALASR